MQNKKYFTLAIAVLAVASVFFLSFPREFVLRVYATGDGLIAVEVLQLEGSAYALCNNFTASGGSIRINDGLYTRFNVRVKLDKTYAENSTRALRFAKVYLTIDNSWVANTSISNVTCYNTDASFYYLLKRYDSNTTLKPVSGVTYSCIVQYWAYY